LSLRIACIGGGAAEYGYTPYALILLRVGNERPCRRAADKTDKLAPSHTAPKVQDRASYRIKQQRWKWAMSALGQKQTCAAHKPMSAKMP
jgi:hypothetical protein